MGNTSHIQVFSQLSIVAAPAPTCTDEVIVFQICNENSALDDNFGIYLNNTFLGNVDLNSNSQIGAIFIGSTNTSITIPDTNTDFPCSVAGMDVYYFNPSLLKADNTIDMVNIQNNGNGNLGTIGVRSYRDLGNNEVIEPVVIDDLSYSGISGENFKLYFDYTACVDRTTLIPPKNLTLTENNGDVDMSWDAAAGYAPPIEYVLSRNDNDTFYQPIGLVSATTFKDTTVSPGNSYKYRVTGSYDNNSSYMQTDPTTDNIIINL